MSNDKPPITSTGIDGFSEKGAPDEWDMAIGEVHGYRWWKLPVPATLAGFKVRGYDQYFASTYRGLLTGANNCTWTDGKQTARCTATSYSFSFSTTPVHLGLTHEPPEYREPCGCGFWAYFDKQLDVQEIMSGFYHDTPRFNGIYIDLPIFGVVRGTGRVIIGEKGFRSQYAEIIGLCVPPKAVKLLSWNVDMGRGYGSYGNRYEEGYASGSVWNALGGSAGASVWGTPGAGNYTSDNGCDYRPVERSQLMARIATVEAWLSHEYPSARILSDQSALTRYFPPDKNYA